MSMRDLKSHISSIHEGIKFYCPLCKEEFTQKYGLDHHVRRFHYGVKPFSCKICDKSFSEHSRINRHIRTVHEGKTLYQCSICNTKFTENGSLKRHISVVHERIKPWCNIFSIFRMPFIVSVLKEGSIDQEDMENGIQRNSS